MREAGAGLDNTCPFCRSKLVVVEHFVSEYGPAEGRKYECSTFLMDYGTVIRTDECRRRELGKPEWCDGEAAFSPEGSESDA